MDAFSASFILLLKIRRSSSMSVNPEGGALRLEAWRMAGMFAICLQESRVWGSYV